MTKDRRDVGLFFYEGIMMQLTRTVLRGGSERDVPEMLQIERACFDTTWTEAELRSAFYEPGNSVIVATTGRRITGFVIWCRRRGVIAILSIAVSSEYQRQGVGTLLLNHVKSVLGTTKSAFIRTHVCERNLTSQLFFKHGGFVVSESVPRYFDDETAYVFTYRSPVELLEDP